MFRLLKIGVAAASLLAFAAAAKPPATADLVRARTAEFFATHTVAEIVKAKGGPPSLTVTAVMVATALALMAARAEALRTRELLQAARG